MNRKSKKAATTTASQFRLQAFVSALVMFGFFVILGLGFEKPWPKAILDGAVVSACRFLAWFAYHSFSRRNDGLIMLAMPGGLFVRTENLPIWELLFDLSLILVLSPTLAILLVRALPPRVGSDVRLDRERDDPKS